MVKVLHDYLRCFLSRSEIAPYPRHYSSRSAGLCLPYALDLTSLFSNSSWFKVRLRLSSWHICFVTS